MTRLHAVLLGSRLPLVSAGLIALAALAGCGGPTPASPNDAAQLPSGADVQARSTDVLQRAKEFNLLTVEIKQADVTRQGPKLQLVFADLANLLPRLAGSKPGGALTEQFRIVTQSRDDLAAVAPGGMIPPGLVDNGLTASFNVVQQLSTSPAYSDEKLTAKVTELKRLVEAAQKSVEIEHAFAVRDVISVLGEATLMMAQTYHERASTIDAQGTGPATAPATAPATVPADAMPPAAPTPPAAPATPAAPTTPETPAPATPPAATEPAAPPAAPTTPAVPADPAAPPAVPAAPAVPTDPAAPPATTPEAPATPAPETPAVPK